MINDAEHFEQFMGSVHLMEIERLRRERLEWFLVARQLRDAVMAKQEVDEALSDYLRVRGRLEDPRDAVEEAIK